MPSSSFNKDFRITDPKVIESFTKALNDTSIPKIPIASRDIKAETEKGIKLLKRSLTSHID